MDEKTKKDTYFHIVINQIHFNYLPQNHFKKNRFSKHINISNLFCLSLIKD